MGAWWSGRHHCIGAAVHAADLFADALRVRCEANGGVIKFEDINDVLAAFKSSSKVQEVSKKVFAQCATAKKTDRTHLLESNDYAAFALFRAFHHSVDHVFSNQIRRSPLVWRVDFAKALLQTAQDAFDVDVTSAAKAAYARMSVEKGASLSLDDVLFQPEIAKAVEAVRVALVKAAGNAELKHLICKAINERLSRSLNIVQPHVLLVSESQIGVFLQTVDMHRLEEC